MLLPDSDIAKYNSLTKSILEKIPDHLIEQAIIDYILEKKYQKNDSEEKSFIRSLTPGMLMLYTTWYFEAEANNGGFNQYFFNSSGSLAKEALDGLELLGAKLHASLLLKAIEIQKSEASLRQQARDMGRIEASAENYKYIQLGALDERFFKLDELSPLRIKYIREHPGEFVSK